jgi:hypothetical protein
MYFLGERMLKNRSLTVGKTARSRSPGLLVSLRLACHARIFPSWWEVKMVLCCDTSTYLTGLLLRADAMIMLELDSSFWLVLPVLVLVLKRKSFMF